MDRRNFLRSMIGGVAAAAAVRTFPFRVFSFPSEIARPTSKQVQFLAADWGYKDPAFVLYGGARGGGKNLWYQLQPGEEIELVGLSTMYPSRSRFKVTSVDPATNVITLT